jgi:hypothetical protein
MGRVRGTRRSGLDRLRRGLGPLGLLCLFGLGALGALGCQQSYYAQYRERHPEWDGSFPREGASLEEVLAGLHAPDAEEGTRIALDALEIWRVTDDGATRIEFEALRRGEALPDPSSDLLVIALRTCRAERGLETLSTPRVGYYLLPEGRLSAWDHYEFGRVCAVRSQFRAARGPALRLELAAVARIASHYGRVPLDLSQLYRRGLAYLEAGRVRDAEAALTHSEPGYLEAEARVRRGEGDAASFQETARLRAQLMRALGVESRQKPPAGAR